MIDYAPSVSVVMEMASREAMQARHEFIMEEHLLLGLLAYVGMDLRPLLMKIARPEVRDMLIAEQRRMQRVLDGQGVDPESLGRSLRKETGTGTAKANPPVMHRSPSTRDLFSRAERRAGAEHCPIGALHLLEEILARPTPIIARLLGGTPGALTEASGGEDKRRRPYPVAGESPAELTHRVTKMRDAMRQTIFGQDHAIETFAEGMFASELATRNRKRPAGVFAFAGPPGVGKTLLAETAAELLERPFLRLDMSSYSGMEDVGTLIGSPPTFHGAEPGKLTAFVKEHPNGILLFDEIEKASTRVIQLFLQILDGARATDRNTGETVDFTGSILIFTTNAGKSLYDIAPAGANWHRRTILRALEGEKNPTTGETIFPAAICSRLGTGYPVLFNRFDVGTLERIATGQLDRTCKEAEHRLAVPFRYAPEIPFLLLLREGAQTDARTLCSQTDSFVKSEIFRLCRLLPPDRIDERVCSAGEIRFEPDLDADLADELVGVFRPRARPRVLLVVPRALGELWSSELADVADVVHAGSEPDVANLLATSAFDMALVDLWVGSEVADVGVDTGGTLLFLDRTPMAAKALAPGLAILRQIHGRDAGLPVYAVQLSERDQAERDEELVLACSRYGVRGVVESGFVSAELTGWGDEVERLKNRLLEIWRVTLRQKVADSLGGEHKVLRFDTVPRIDADTGRIRILLRNMTLEQAVEAEDVADVLSDVDRPSITLADVFGAAAAKEELQFVVNWLQDPGRFRALGLHPPRGVLLYGDPGTGKTMLARALAGECRVSFLAISATSFVTKWQGSGPENVRALFARARRYAPSIVFIDEIDAIGKAREGSVNTAASEQTLNALLVEMEGFSRAPAGRPVVVMAATNLVSTLDPALRRRFDREVEVDPPDRDARLAYLRHRLLGRVRSAVEDETIERMASQSAGLTVSDLERIIDMAGRIAARDSGVLSGAVLEEAFERIRFGDIRKLSNPDTVLRIARHEAGHCLVSCLQGTWPLQVSIVSRGGTGGFVESESHEDFSILTKKELENRMCVTMGGRAAEIVYYGEEEGLSTGASGDLRQAWALAEAMVCEYGMGRSNGSRRPRSAHLPTPDAVSDEISAIIDTQLRKAVKMLADHRSVLDGLVKELEERNRLTREEIQNLIQS